MPLHQEPSQTGVKAWPESRGEPGLWPGFGHVGQGIKNREATATGSAWPGLAAVGRGLN